MAFAVASLEVGSSMGNQEPLDSKDTSLASAFMATASCDKSFLVSSLISLVSDFVKTSFLDLSFADSSVTSLGHRIYHFRAMGSWIWYVSEEVCLQ